MDDSLVNCDLKCIAVYEIILLEYTCYEFSVNTILANILKIIILPDL